MKLGDSYKIEAGLKTIARTMDYDFYSKRAYENNTVYTPDVNLNNGFTYSDQVYSAYGTFTGGYKKFGYSAGLRAEQTFYTVNQTTLNQKFDRNYFSLFPSAFLKYKMNEGTEFGLSYSRRINRPRGWDLNPFPDYSDPYFLFVGNPYLKPEYVNSFDVSAQVIAKKITIAPSVYYRYTTGVFTRFRDVDSLGVSRITSYNLNTSHSGGLDLTFRYDATKWWRININGGGFFTKLNADNLQQGLTATRWGGMGRAMMSFKVIKGLDIQWSYSLGVPWVFTQGYIKPFQNMDVSVKYDFWKDRLSVVARLSDVFNQRQFGYVTDGIGFHQDGVRKRETRWVNLSVTWKFGKLIPQSKRPKAAPSEMQDNGGGGGGF
jgi:outer membrane receptor protein involved in Fe transport